MFDRDRRFRTFWGLLALPVMNSPRALPVGNYSSRGHVIIAARSALVFFVRRICKTATNFLLTRAMLSSAYSEGPIMRLPGNARLGSTLYFKSPSLGEIMFIDVDVTPDEDGEVELLPEGIAELTARWCVPLNRMRKVRDFRPATREEVPVCVQRHNGVNPGRAHAMSMRRLARATSAPRGASANGVRYRLPLRLHCCCCSHATSRRYYS
jgi:hypothetical protein